MSKSKENSMFGKKRSKLSVLPVIFSSVLAAGALAGTGVSIWQVSKNYQESSEFKKSYNARINVNPVAYEKDVSNKEIAEANLKESATRLSAWLKYNGAESYDVSYELGEQDSATKAYNSGWLSAYYTVNKVAKKHPTKDNDEKIDNDPYLSYFDAGGFNTNNRTIVYRWYNESTETATAQGPFYTLLDFKDVFDMPTNLSAKDNNTKTLIDKDGKNGVLYKITNNSTLNQICQDLKDAYKKSQDKNKIEKEFQKPRLYIVNNIEQMFNEINYHLLNYSTYSTSGASGTGIDYYNLYDGSDYEKFSKTIRSQTKFNEKREDKGETAPIKLGTALVKDSKDGTPYDLANGEALHYLDISKVGTIESSFLNKYVEKVFTFENKDYEKFFPEKITDTYYNKGVSAEAETPDLSYAWYPANSSTDADSYLSKQVNNGLKCKVKSINASSAAAVDALAEFKQSFTSREVPAKFVDNIFGGSNLIGTLSLGFLLFLIALLIILAVLYRTTGVMSWICMMFMLSMTGLIATAGSSIISMSLLFGLFAMSLVGFIAALAICGRVKRRICSNEDTSVAVIKGLKKSVWPLVDISFITLLFGICFTYIAPMNLNPLGIILIIGGFGTFICMYLLNALLMLLFFNNGLTMNKFIFLGKPNNRANEALAQSNSFVPSSLDATKLEFAFYDRVTTTKFSLINWTTLIIVSVFGLLLIAGIVTFSVKGLSNSSLFHSSMCVVLTSNDAGIISALPASFQYTTMTHTGNYWYFYCDTLNADVISAMRTSVTEYIASHTGVTASLEFGNVIGNTNKDILNYALLSILITTLCASVYTGIRSNWTTFVPMLAGSVLVPLMMIGVGSMAQIQFDQNVVLGFALAVVFNTLISNTMLASINEAWFRKESYTKDELKFIVTTAAKNNLSYILICTLAYALFIVFFGVCSPNGLSSLTVLMAIGAIISMVVTPLTVSYLLYWFLLIRAKILTKRAERLANKVVVNMDEIDEQSIEGINKFTKQKAYAKKKEFKPGEAH